MVAVLILSAIMVSCGGGAQQSTTAPEKHTHTEAPATTAPAKDSPTEAPTVTTQASEAETTEVGDVVDFPEVPI